MTNFFKENGKTLLIFLTIAIIFPIIILLPSPIGIIPYETGLTIIGYGGSILGGFLTLYGVWWTIEDNNMQREENQRQHDEERREEFTIKYKPILFFKKVDDRIYDTNGEITLFTQENKEPTEYELLTYFTITNLGRGEAVIKDYDYDICDTISEENSLIFPKTEIERDYIKMIPITNSLNWELGICFNQAELTNLIKKTEDEMLCYFTFKIIYADILDNQEYNLDIIFVFETYLKENKIIFEIKEYNQIIKNINKRGGQNVKV